MRKNRKNKRNPKTAPTEIIIRPPAESARAKKRHWGLLFSFLLFVVVPSCIAGLYLWTRAADQYTSKVAFSVRTEEAGSAFELFGGISQLSSGSSSDTDILYEFIQSQDLVGKIDDRLDLKTLYSKPREIDPVLTFDPEGTVEDLVKYWERMVKISYDSGTGLIDLRIHAFDPQDAQQIAAAIFDESTAMINRLSAIARADATGYAREELDKAVERLTETRLAVTLFRNTTQIVDPNADLQLQMGLLNTLQQQLAESLIDLDLLIGTTREGDPRLQQSERKIKVIEERISEERKKFGVGDLGDDSTYASLVGEYERLTVEREFAEAAYTSALSAFDASQAEAQRQSRYLAAYVEPTLAERAEYPQRGILLGIIFAFLFMFWSILALVYYSLKDHS
ncbi:MAG: hypothetical protein ABJO67_17300 [Pseudoruegeria sp.]